MNAAALAARVQELAAPVQRASSTALALEAGLTSLNDTLTTVSRLPGLSVEPPPAQLAEPWAASWVRWVNAGCVAGDHRRK